MPGDNPTNAILLLPVNGPLLHLSPMNLSSSSDRRTVPMQQRQHYNRRHTKASKIWIWISWTHLRRLFSSRLLLKKMRVWKKRTGILARPRSACVHFLGRGDDNDVGWPQHPPPRRRRWVCTNRQRSRSQSTWLCWADEERWSPYVIFHNNNEHTES